MIFYKREAILTNEVIAEWSQEVAQEYLKQAGKRAIVETKIRLAVEELLIKFRRFYGTETPCRIVGRKRFGQLTFELRQEGPQIDPVAQPEDELQFAYDILSRLDVRPRYSYIARRHMNFVTLPAELGPVKNQMLFLMLSALVLAVVSCLALSSFAPNAAEIIYTGITLPVFNKLTAVIAALATPLVFLAVITGITGLDDAASFGRIGKRVCGAAGEYALLQGQIRHRRKAHGLCSAARRRGIHALRGGVHRAHGAFASLRHRHGTHGLGFRARCDRVGHPRHCCAAHPGLRVRSHADHVHRLRRAGERLSARHSSRHDPRLPASGAQRLPSAA